MILVIDEIVDMFVKFCSKELIYFKIMLVQLLLKILYFYVLRYFMKF